MDPPIPCPVRRQRLVIGTMLAAPLVGYVAAVALPVLQRGRFVFGWGDLAILGIVVGYVLAAGRVLLVGDRLRLWQFLALSYSVIGTLALSEIVLSWLWPLPALAAPHMPTRLTFAVGDAMPGISGTVEFSVNDLGLRGPAMSLDDAALKVLCVGGSTTECLYVTDKLSWPWLLENLLQQATGKKVYVGNAGKSGHLTPHHHYLLSHYRPATDFDGVLLLCGYNDLNTLACAGSYEQRLPRVAEETLIEVGRADHPGYQRLALFRQALRLVEEKRVGVIAQDYRGDWYARERETRRRALARQPLSARPARFERALASYRDNLERIVELCHDRGQTLMLMTQPTMYRKDLTEELQQLLYNHVGARAYTTEVLAEMMDAFNRVLLDVARERGVPCLDLAALLPADTSVFYDDCHFNISGCRRVAELTAEFLARQGPIARVP